MEDSILKSTKKVLQIGDDDPSFDLDILTHINSAFSNLHDLGVGPEAGFFVEDDTKVWADFLSGDTVKLSKVKTAVYLRVRLLFDPPSSVFLLNAAQEQLKEVEWRLNTNREATEWVDPTPPTTVDEDPFDPEPDPLVVIDGGNSEWP